MSNVNDFIIENGVLKEYMGSDSEVVIPEDDSITSIGDNAFRERRSIKSITVSRTITSIGKCAFWGCCNLETIQLHDGITSIGSSAFAGCERLKSIVLPKKLTNIEPGTFCLNTALESVTMFDDVKTIGYGAFEFCSNLKDINLSNSLTTLLSECFSKCTSLKDITLPSSLKRIDSGAFFCTSISNIVIPKNVCEIEELAFNYTNPVSISVEAGNSVYHSDGNCLIDTAKKTLILGCENSIIPIDGSVSWIGRSAFNGCKRITSVRIPELSWSFRIRREHFSKCEKIFKLEIHGAPEIENRSFENIEISFLKAPGLVAANGFAWWRERFGEVNAYIAAFDNFDIGSKIAKYAKRTYENAFKAIMLRDRTDLVPIFLSMWKKFDEEVFERLVNIAIDEHRTEFAALLLDLKNNTVS